MLSTLYNLQSGSTCAVVNTDIHRITFLFTDRYSLLIFETLSLLMLHHKTLCSMYFGFVVEHSTLE